MEAKTPNKEITHFTEEYVYALYCERVQPRIDDIRRMFFEGYSFTEVAKELDVSSSLLWKMRRNKKSQYAELREAFEFQSAQIQNVETALYRKAVGFYYDEDEKVAVVKEYFNKRGEKCKEPVVKTVKVRKYCPPDVNAIKFFLLNHAAKQYSPEGSAEQAQTQAMIDGLKNVFVSVRKKAEEEAGDE